ncbi:MULTISPECIES: DUF6765 family protein [Cyanophyceae]|uniref:Uncharacterized protein n=1 Tax=Leptolyngbya subtilissima DQ-A4 TaxID=2933933 RepID=A0ABV0K1S1_9CYAN|nr:DUF6765 family protein [Nodosilinea sp. FACHB-141]MBD2111191.1 hypothetical protein [Nodosilinea sp. FACHB-141]
MQIDFHHGVTYVCARLAGFEHQEADIVAHSAQYVDDSTQAGLIRFDNGAMFDRISSAHKMLDYRNFKELANCKVWIPFHFLPGNGGLPAGQDPPGTFIEKLICRPNSPVAQTMVRECIEQRYRSYGLHRLGITLHVFADTWAHQGFAGVSHEINSARDLVDGNDRPDQSLMNRLKGFFIGGALPLGHGTVLSNPDKPYLRWGYTNGRGEKISRDNPKDYLAAANELCKAMQRYRLGNADADVPGLPAADKDKIAMLFETTLGEGDCRHRQWIDHIAQGSFSFGPAQVSYIANGYGSWKHKALGIVGEGDGQRPALGHRIESRLPYSPQFLDSNWKLFHDALRAHHFYVIHDLLPQYGICVA